MTAPRTPAGRISRRAIEATRVRLSDRDLAILRSVEQARLLTALHVERLHFYKGSPQTTARRCRATLQRLTNARCLARLERRIGGVRAGSASFIYTVTPFGQRVLHPDAEQLRRIREPGRSFVDHVLAVSELWVQLTEADRSGTLDLLAFHGEPSCWRSFPGPGGEPRWVKPDARVVIGAGEWEHHWFVEVDLGTESSTVIRTKATAYIAHWQAGAEQQRTGIYPKILFVVPDDRRRQRIVDTLAGLPADRWQLFQVGLIDDQVLTIRGHPQAGDVTEELNT